MVSLSGEADLPSAGEERERVFDAAARPRVDLPDEAVPDQRVRVRARPGAGHRGFQQARSGRQQDDVGACAPLRGGGGVCGQAPTSGEKGAAASRVAALPLSVPPGANRVCPAVSVSWVTVWGWSGVAAARGVARTGAAEEPASYRLEQPEAGGHRRMCGKGGGVGDDDPGDAPLRPVLGNDHSPSELTVMRLKITFVVVAAWRPLFSLPPSPKGSLESYTSIE